MNIIIKNGYVYIVGVGPGDPELITLKAKKVIEKADVILYDRLVNKEILNYAKKDAELVYVGKEPKKNRFPQSEIHRLMLKYFLEDKIVVRLKGGDPYVFGRGSEEAIFLKEHNIPFEVIPGITSALGASAYAGIPLTHRSMVTQVVFLTAHEDPSKENSQLDLAKIAKLENATIVIYMGAAKLENIVSELIKNGMNPKISAAIVENATLINQRTFAAELAELPKIAKKNNLQPPLLILISPCVNFISQLNWYDKKPLAGKRVITTRALDQSQSLFQILREERAEVIPFPVFRTQEIPPNPEYLEKIAKTRFNWVIFTSQNGVRYFFKSFFSGSFPGLLLLPKIAVLGPNTEAELSKYGYSAAFMPTKYDSETFVNEFLSRFNIDNYKILRVKGKFEKDQIIDELKCFCRKIVPLEVYETIKEEHSEEEIEELLNSNADAIIFTASTTVNYFFEILGEERAKEFLNKLAVFAIGSMTDKALKAKGYVDAFVSQEHTVEGIVKLMKSYFSGKNFGLK